MTKNHASSAARLERAWVLAALLALAGCATPFKASVADLHQSKESVRQYVSSGRYDADVAAVVKRAETWLERRARAGGKLAIVLDIDETSLSNLRWLKLNDWGVILEGATNTVSGPCGLWEWIQTAQSKPILPTLNLTRDAREHGVAVFFITARPERARAATEKNLREAGYQWTGLVLKPARPEGAPKPRSESEYKAAARKQITETGFTIVLNLGDQESDLAGGYAERTFKMPNPFYFVP